jgi:uncharacterized membrane protein
MGEDIGVSHQPTGAAFDIVLLLHIACVIVGLGTIVTSAAIASRMRRLAERSAAVPETLARYFRPGVNWAGRAVYGIPVFGFALLAMSKGAYDLADGWVLGGLGVFVLLALLAEGVLWPAEQRLQVALAEPVASGAAPRSTVTADLRRMGRSAAACSVLLIFGTVLMVAQP